MNLTIVSGIKPLSVALHHAIVVIKMFDINLTDSQFITPHLTVHSSSQL